MSKEKDNVLKKIIEIEKRIERIELFLDIIVKNYDNSSSSNQTQILDTLTVDKKKLNRIYDLYDSKLSVIYKFPNEMTIPDKTQKILKLLLIGQNIFLNIEFVHSSIIHENLNILNIDTHNFDRNIEDLIPDIVRKKIDEGGKNSFRLTNYGKDIAKNLLLEIIGD